MNAKQMDVVNHTAMRDRCVDTLKTITNLPLNQVRILDWKFFIYLFYCLNDIHGLLIARAFCKILRNYYAYPTSDFIYNYN